MMADNQTMTSPLRPGRVSIFAPATAREREENFESYWLYQQRRDGEILEDAKDLAEKQKILRHFQEHPVRTRRPVAEAFHRNYVTMRDDPRSLDRRTLLLTFLYKFARHEWIGISAAWDETPTVAQAKYLIDKISRYHLAEEFCHMRLFQEIFRTFGLEDIEWGPLPKRTKQLYAVFARLPGPVVAPPAFVSELMGLTVYLHVDAMLDDIVADEPAVRTRDPRIAPHDHDGRAVARRGTAQLHGPDWPSRGQAHGEADVSRVLRRDPREPAAVRHAPDAERGRGVRLQRDLAGGARRKLGAVVLHAFVAAPTERTA